MIKKSLKNLTLMSLVMSPLAHATTTYPVGMVNVTIEAATSDTEPTSSYLSTSMSAELVYQCKVSTGDIGTVSISSNRWEVNQFSTVPHYVIIASGPREGEMLDIASNSGHTLTFAGASATENQNDLVGETIRIHKHNTIASIFGANPAENTVKKGDQDTADKILLYNNATASYDTYYYNNVVSPETEPSETALHLGWVEVGNSTVDASNTAIYPDDGFIYKRLSTSNFNLNVNGSIICNVIKVPIITGYNVVAIPYPVDKSITLTTSGLENNLQKGDKDTADRVLIYNSTNKEYDIYYYNTTQTVVDGESETNLHVGWVKLDANTVDASSTIIPSGKAILILRKEGNTAFHWTFQNVLQASVTP